MEGEETMARIGAAVEGEESVPLCRARNQCHCGGRGDDSWNHSVNWIVNAQEQRLVQVL